MKTTTKIASGIAGVALAAGAAVGIPAVLEPSPTFLVTSEGEELTRDEVIMELSVIDQHIPVLMAQERQEDVDILLERKEMLETLLTP